MKLNSNFKSLLLFFCIFANYSVKAQGTFVVDNIKYQYENNTSTNVSVIPNDEYYSGDIIIPDKVNYNRKQYRVSAIGEYAFQWCSKVTSIQIPNSVTLIDNYAFFECIGLNTITIPNSVTSIGVFAFTRCTALTSISIPKSMILIGTSSFSGCKNLTSITIPNSVTTIGSSAFSKCTNLNYVSIPSTITSIEDYLFEGCSALNSITIPSSVTAIGDFAFSGCTNLTSIIIPDGVTSINYSTFSDCKKLNSLSIPNSVTTIESFAFSKCSSLTSITFPSGLTSIGASCFAGCTGLTSITSLNTEPPVVGIDTFSEIDYINCIVYVPVGSLQKYSFAEGWNQFSHVIENNTMSAEKTGINTVKVYTEGDGIVVDGAGYGENIGIFELSGKQINTTVAKNNLVKFKLPTDHSYIIRIGQKSSKIILKANSKSLIKH